ncbi:MAG: hypothetical protein NTU47_01770 [Ignavibacteriales bacterium]|nr:hypothetical protein [Ignavibacteriales bacterium]
MLQHEAGLLVEKNDRAPHHTSEVYRVANSRVILWDQDETVLS